MSVLSFNFVSGLNCRANEADDVMVSASEIKRIALSIEEELFAYYGEVNTRYKHKFRTLITHLKDKKNAVKRFAFCHIFRLFQVPR